MFHATIESDMGDALRVVLPNGRIGGKAALSFITGLSVRCPQADEKTPVDVLEWFSGLDPYLEHPICHIAQILVHSFYGGEWDYAEDEYELFIRRSPQNLLTEEEFKKATLGIALLWTNVNILLASVNELLRALTLANLKAVWWYEPSGTEIDFQALAQTLSLAAERGAKQVRIKFT